MIKYSSLALLLVFCVLSAHAQTFIGVRSGINYSKINGIGSIKDNFDWKEGYHIGAFLYKRIGDRLFLQPELLYNTRGYIFLKQYPKDKVVSGDTIAHYQNTRLNYLDVPFLARQQFKKFYFEVGPQFGFILSGKTSNRHTLEKNGETTYLSSNHRAKEMVEDLDVGFVIGLGYQLDQGVGLNFRYNQGFHEVVKRVNWQKNILFQASASYIIGYNAFVKRRTKEGSSVMHDDIQEVYYKPSKGERAGNKGYRVLSKQNVQRFSVVKMGESTKSEIHFKFASAGARSPMNLLISGSSGVEEQTPLFIGFRDIEVPFKGMIKYVTPSTVGINSIESYLELEITEPAIWRVNILTQ